MRSTGRASPVKKCRRERKRVGVSAYVLAYWRIGVLAYRRAGRRIGEGQR
jgi:hypothetical protein